LTCVEEELASKNLSTFDHLRLSSRQTTRESKDRYQLLSSNTDERLPIGVAELEQYFMWLAAGLGRMIDRVES
jgi:hypothetical protein